MEITKSEFDKKLNDVANQNWKIKKLLDDCGGYENFPKHLKLQLHNMMGVRVSNKYENI